MGGANCAVIGCSNSTYKLKKWQASLCHKKGHEGTLKNGLWLPAAFLFIYVSI